MRIIFQKPDLDTCLSALILGVSAGDDVCLAPSGATNEELGDVQVLCIEAGGSGHVEFNNYDHHDPSLVLPPACVQAWKHIGCDPALERLVRYVSLVDEARPGAEVAFPSLSNVFSGMLLLERDSLRRFFTGIELLREILMRGIDPFETLPDVEDWRPYVEAKEINKGRVEASLKDALFFTTSGGIKVGFCESRVPGGIGTLYAQGCEVVIMYNPVWGDPPVRKYTIASQDRPVAVLLDTLNRHEPGWGGRATIIGSPRTGSRLRPDEVMAVVKEFLRNAEAVRDPGESDIF